MYFLKIDFKFGPAFFELGPFVIHSYNRVTALWRSLNFFLDKYFALK